MTASPVDWTVILPLPIADFHERYTLHDSSLVSVWTDPVGAVVCAISLDLHWNLSVPKGHDELLVRFGSPYRLVWTRGGWLQSTLSGAETHQLSEAERTQLLDDPSLPSEAYQGDESPGAYRHPAMDTHVALTRFELMNWGTLEILHGGDVQFAVINPEGAVIDLSLISGR